MVIFINLFKYTILNQYFMKAQEYLNFQMEHLISISNSKKQFLTQVQKIKHHQKKTEKQRKFQHCILSVFQQKHNLLSSLSMIQSISNSKARILKDSFRLLRNHKQQTTQFDKKSSKYEQNAKIGGLLLKQFMKIKVERILTEAVGRLRKNSSLHRKLTKMMKGIGKMGTFLSFYRIKTSVQRELNLLRLSTISFEQRSSKSIPQKFMEKEEICSLEQSKRKELKRKKQYLLQLKQENDKQGENLCLKTENLELWDENSVCEESTNQLLLGKYMRLVYQLQDKLITVKLILEGMNSHSNSPVDLFLRNLIRVCEPDSDLNLSIV